MTIDTEGATFASEPAAHMPANEWEASGNILLYTEMNSRFVQLWREKFATDPAIRELVRKAFDS